MRFISKGIICIIDRTLKSLSLLEGICDLTNNIAPSFLSVISSQCGEWWPIGKRFSWFRFCYTQIINIYNYYFILFKSSNLILMELIFRYEKIMLLRCKCRKSFRVSLLFSSYSELVVVDASIKEVTFTFSSCLLLDHAWQNYSKHL